MRISDWSSDVCSSDLRRRFRLRQCTLSARILLAVDDVMPVGERRRASLVADLMPDGHEDQPPAAAGFLDRRFYRRHALHFGPEPQWTMQADTAAGPHAARLAAPQLSNIGQEAAELRMAVAAEQIGRASGRERVCQYV